MNTIQGHEGVIREFQGAYRFLSNFWPSEMLPPTLEHHYQAAKGEFWSRLVMEAKTAGEAKKIGREFPGFQWNDHSEKVMVQLIRQKFGGELELQDKLLATGEQELVEGNRWHDNLWGVCYCKTERCAGKVGQNKLGKLLMQVREEIRVLTR